MYELETTRNTNLWVLFFSTYSSWVLNMSCTIIEIREIRYSWWVLKKSNQDELLNVLRVELVLNELEISKFEFLSTYSSWVCNTSYSIIETREIKYSFWELKKTHQNELKLKESDFFFRNEISRIINRSKADLTRHDKARNCQTCQTWQGKKLIWKTASGSMASIKYKKYEVYLPFFMLAWP